MRKILFASIALLLFSMQAKAQKYFDVYQNGKVTTSIASTNIDSIGLTGTTMQDRKVNFYRNSVPMRNNWFIWVLSASIRNYTKSLLMCWLPARQNYTHPTLIICRAKMVPYYIMQ